MKKIFIILFFSFIYLQTNAQNIYGNWVLTEVETNGGKFEREDDKLLAGNRLNLKLSPKHKYKAVLHGRHFKEHYENSMLEGETFIMLNDREGNITYSILSTKVNSLIIERVFTGNRHVIFKFSKANKKNKHDHFVLYN